MFVKDEPIQSAPRGWAIARMVQRPPRQVSAGSRTSFEASCRRCRLWQTPKSCAESFRAIALVPRGGTFRPQRVAPSYPNGLRLSAPTGLRLPAQGCDEVATLGLWAPHNPQPQRGCGAFDGERRNPFRVVCLFERNHPKVAAARQPWAGGRNAVGARRWSFR